MYRPPDQSITAVYWYWRSVDDAYSTTDDPGVNHSGTRGGKGGGGGGGGSKLSKLRTCACEAIEGGGRRVE